VPGQRHSSYTITAAMPGCEHLVELHVPCQLVTASDGTSVALVVDELAARRHVMAHVRGCPVAVEALGQL